MRMIRTQVQSLVELYACFKHNFVKILDKQLDITPYEWLCNGKNTIYYM